MKHLQNIRRMAVLLFVFGAGFLVAGSPNEILTIIYAMCCIVWALAWDYFQEFRKE